MLLLRSVGNERIGQAPTLHLLYEIRIFGAAWLNFTSYYIEDIQRDWRTNIPSWLGIPGGPSGEKKMINYLDYFGWVGEPDSINEVIFVN